MNARLGRRPTLQLQGGRLGGRERRERGGKEVMLLLGRRPTLQLQGGREGGNSRGGRVRGMGEEG